MRSSAVGLGLVISLGAVVGCGFHSPPAQGDDTPGDGAPGTGACTTFASQVDTCKLAFGGDLTLSGRITYDTGTHELKVDGTAMPVGHMTLTTLDGTIDAIFARNVRLTTGALLKATGTLPFGIIASGSVTLEDASQIDLGNGGAGALAVCSNPPTAGGNSSGGGAGGGGGGFGGAGGDGSNGDSDGNGSVGGVKSNSIGMPIGPLGGCPGAAGGAGGLPGGAGGLGGGALYIAAASRIDLRINAALTAGGGGGHGGPQSGDAGGGGGGSGGMIVLDAPHVIGPQARVAANGGGGGEGSNTTQLGRDGDPGASSALRASGGAGLAVDGTDGGRGGSMEEPSGETVTMRLKAGGGGGGGGVGYIHIVSADSQLGSVSPAAQ